MSDLEKNMQLTEQGIILSIERTFSAWIRTGLTGIAGGIAILKLISFNTIFMK